MTRSQLSKQSEYSQAATGGSAATLTTITSNLTKTRQEKPPTSQVANDPIPVVKAVSTRDTVRQHAGGAAVTPVTLVATDPQLTHTLTRLSVTLGAQRTLLVTVTH